MAEKIEKATKSGKTVTLTFSTDEELKFHAAFEKAAIADDRSISSFMVRFIMGKEENPMA